MQTFLLVDKEIGWTSNDVVRKLKWPLKERGVKKIGHAGTLDPFATGLLIIMLNEGTKRFDEYQKLKKEYIAEIEFGKVTDTYDIDGQVVQIYDGEVVLEKEKIENILKEKFKGKILQTPPFFSALKINGKRAYDFARNGEGGELMKDKTREVEIYETEVLGLDKNILTLRLVVSSGTYIRSITYDLGVLTLYGAYCKSLRRTKIGEYRVEDAKKIGGISSEL